MDIEILNLEQACELLNVSDRTLIKLLREEHIPARKIGREWRFSKTALINWLSTGDSYEYANKEDVYEVFEDREGEAQVMLDKVIDEVALIKDDKYISAILRNVSDKITLPNNATLRVSYKQKREIEKLEFKLFWAIRDEYKVTSKDK